MNSKLLVTAVLGTAFLISCGSQKNFNSRKYTKGNFRITSKRLKSDQPKSVHQEEVAFQTEEAVTSEKIASIRTNSNERTNQFQLDEVSNDELGHVPVETTNTLVTENTSMEIERISDQRQNPRSQISKAKAPKKKAKKKDQLTAEQRHARTSLIFGIIAISLMVTLITLAFISFAPYGTPALYYFGRSIRAAIIPAFFGMGYSVLAKLGKGDLGKYKKHAKIGFWMSLCTFLLWFLLI